MRAVWNGQVLAEADKEDLIFIESYWYFPPDSVNFDVLFASETPYTCPWKGECQYYDIIVGGETNDDAAFTYPKPLPTAIERIHKDFGGYVAFWRGVEVSE